MRDVLFLCTVVVLLVVGTTVHAEQTCVKKPQTLGVRELNSAVQTNLDLIENEISEEEDCDCVPYYLCVNNTIIYDGKGLIDIRITPQKCSTLEVCCSQSSQITENDDGTGLNKGQRLPFKPTPSLGCGQRNLDGVGFSITGATMGEAQFGEFPWMAALLVLEDGQELFSGGGSLIHPQVVLTAAHSVERFKTDPSSLHVRVGEWDTQSAAEILPHEQLAVKEVILHEKFDKATLYNDIALLILSQPVDPAQNVGTVCLPENEAMINTSNCIATGWGRDVFGKAGCYQVILKSIELPIVAWRNCQKLMRKTRLGKRFRLHTSFTCAGGEEGKDACMGDGGGPLVCPIPGEENFYQQAGIIAWGIGCGEKDVPGVYTNVARFRTWIDDKFAKHSLDSASYQRPWEDESPAEYN